MSSRLTSTRINFCPFLSLKCETVDPTTVKFSELTGHEKVGVVNRNTQERVSERGGREGACAGVKFVLLMNGWTFSIATSKAVTRFKKLAVVATRPPTLQRRQ